MARKHIPGPEIVVSLPWLRPIWAGLLDAPRFITWRFWDGLKRSLIACEATAKGVVDTVLGRQKGLSIGYRATLKSAATYCVIAGIWGSIEGDLDPLMLISAAVIGAVIGPGLAPWLRLFPVTGDPRYQSWQRFIDLAINMLFHLVATSLFVFLFKLFVAGSLVPLLGSFEAPNFFKGSTGLVVANYLRKYATESLGVGLFLKHHPLGPTLLAELSQRADETEAHRRLRAWNELRELPGPGLLGVITRGWGQPARGFRSLIDESKMVDPALAGLIDHFLLLSKLGI